MAGDHQQLPPTVKSVEAVKLGLSETILDRMTMSLEACYLLNIQYRMHEQILAFSNKQFYDNQLRSAEFVRHRALPNDTAIINFIDTSGCGFEEAQGAFSRSYYNLGEYHILREHLLAHADLLSEKVVYRCYQSIRATSQ